MFLIGIFCIFVLCKVLLLRSFWLVRVISIFSESLSRQLAEAIPLVGLDTSPTPSAGYDFATTWREVANAN